MDDYKFQVDFLNEATEFLDGLNEKTPKKEIDKAERIRQEYFKQKAKNK